jgi:phosphohistidine phosphatase
MAGIALHFLRHAHAGDPERWDGPDEARPLSAKGERQAARLGALLAGAGFEPDVILTSPKVRAERTARIVADALGRPIRVDERLGAGLGFTELAALLDELGPLSRPVLVGHDPDFSDLLSELVGAPVALRKGALARFDVELPLEPGAGVLRWLVPPDLLAPKG